jgi:NitT/TauT family transport system permease protein
MANPSVALIPLALFFIQPELNAKIALIVFAASRPILINTLYGVRENERMEPCTACGMRAGRGHRFCGYCGHPLGT